MKKWIRILIVSILGFLGIGGIFLYNNYNRLLAEALLRTFNSSLVSEVYELKFENLSVNLLEGDIKVFNVSLLPREKPLRVYPYINSSFRLKTKKLALENVEIRSLLKSNVLILDKIIIEKPEIEVFRTGKRSIMLPFKDTTSVSNVENEKKGKKLGSFLLKEFQLNDAIIHITNEGKQREFEVENFSISLQALMVSQQPGEYQTSCDRVALSFGGFSGKGPLREINFKDFTIGIDSLDMQLTKDTLQYRFHDFTSRLTDLDVLTIDSLFQVTIQSFDLSYSTQSIKLERISIKPNVSHAAIQQRYTYQHTEFTGAIGSLELHQVNFDSIMYAKKLLIGEVVLDSVQASIFKNKTKPLDKNKFPAYLGQTVRAIKLPLRINHIKASHVNLYNTELKPDNTLAKVTIASATMDVNNFTNLFPQSSLDMQADAWLDGKAHFTIGLAFQYSKPQFAFEGKIQKFNLPDLSPLIQAYTPAKINKGVADEISFSGVAEETSASGTMKFLYHGLEVDLDLQDQARWKSSLLAFAANTILDSSNPADADLPPKIVKFKIERDMNKGFVNVVIKSLLNGLRETMLMSKENRKAYQKTVKEEKKKR